MRRLERDHLFETPAGFDEPLEMLLGCHRRIEKQLETLRRLRAHLETHAVDAQASIAAQNVLRYFTSAALNHHADEEQDLFPLLESRIDDGGEKARFAAFRARLEADHRTLESAWLRLKRFHRWSVLKWFCTLGRVLASCLYSRLPTRASSLPYRTIPL